MDIIMRRHVRRVVWTIQRRSKLLEYCIGAAAFFVLMLLLILWAAHIKFG